MTLTAAAPLSRELDIWGAFLPSELGLWGAALITIAIETPLFWLAGYRRGRDALAFAAINLMSNLLLNEFVRTLPPHLVWNRFWEIAIPGELVVVALEFCLCRCAVPDARGGLRLLLVVFGTNLTSFLAGVLYAPVLRIFS